VRRLTPPRCHLASLWAQLTHATTIGDVLPARPTGAEGFKVLRTVPERALVLGGMSPQWAGTWAFVLEPLGPDKTRLVTRYRAAYPPSARMAIMLPVLATAHAIMERKSCARSSITRSTCTAAMEQGDDASGRRRRSSGGRASSFRAASLRSHTGASCLGATAMTALSWRARYPADRGNLAARIP